MICEVMAAEVTELCGPKHHPYKELPQLMAALERQSTEG